MCGCGNIGGNSGAGGASNVTDQMQSSPSGDFDKILKMLKDMIENGGEAAAK